MTIEKKLLGTNPSASGPTNVADVFSTHVYTGNDTTGRDIVNGIDLSGEGGMVWTKCRSLGHNHRIHDTERGVGKHLTPNATLAEGNDADEISAFNANGYSIGADLEFNDFGATYVSFTFRKKKKFFTCLTYSGNSTAGHTVSHNLGSAPAMMIIKQTNGTNNWHIYHKNVNKDGAAAQNTALFFAADGGDSKVGYFNNTAPTDSVFTLGSYGGDWGINGSGENYVAYLFADNSAEDADEQMIKCGSYTGNNSVVGPYVSLGWEAQFILVKSIGTDDWSMWDTMRGLPEGTGHGNAKPYLNPSSSSGDAGTNSGLSVDADGFHVTGVGGQTNDSGVTYIYMAIRAPMMKEPESATEVFHSSTRTGVSSNVVVSGVGFAPDMVFMPKRSGGDTYVLDKTRGKVNSLTINRTSAEVTSTAATKDLLSFDMDGISMGVSWNQDFNSNGTTFIDYFLKRAKGFFDVVGYRGTGSATTVNHQLSVIPEMIWFKGRNLGSQWICYIHLLGGTKYMQLTQNVGSTDLNTFWNDTDATESVFTVGINGDVNGSNTDYIAYLFASLDGVSKVGSYTGNGTSQTINCGFAAGARFVLIKRTDASGDWYFWDTTRGIVSGNDPHLALNETAAEVTTVDSIDPHNSGFIVNQDGVGVTDLNQTNQTYVFYAIA